VMRQAGDDQPGHAGHWHGGDPGRGCDDATIGSRVEASDQVAPSGKDAGSQIGKLSPDSGASVALFPTGPE
jgi:hypothetical protein